MDLEKIISNLLEEEGITKEVIEMVDLEIGFSPVIPIKGSRPMEVIKLEGGRFRVPECPMAGLNITSEELKIMRARFLINRK